jgi:hypothetical protein
MRFIAYTLGSVALITTIWVALSLARIGEPVEVRIANSCRTIDMKRQIADRAPSPKVAVIGASNVLFGIRTDMIAAQTGVSAMNVGLPASLGIDIIFATARSVLKPGDTAVLTLELFFFENKGFDGPFIREALFQCNTHAFFDLPPLEQAHALLLQSVPNMVKAVVGKTARWLGFASAASSPPPSVFDRSGFNSHGDFLENDAWRLKPEQREWVRERPGGTVLEFSSEGPTIHAVRKFVAWAKDHRITVLAAWPAVYWPRRDLAEPGLGKIRAFYESLDVPVLGDPMDTMPPLEQFFDTNNHLTAEAAKERTEVLVRQLMPFLRVPSGAK